LSDPKPPTTKRAAEMVWICQDGTQVFLCETAFEADMVRRGPGRSPQAQARRIPRSTYEAWWRGRIKLNPVPTIRAKRSRRGPAP
jgi:hypothetical protein